MRRQSSSSHGTAHNGQAVRNLRNRIFPLSQAISQEGCECVYQFSFFGRWFHHGPALLARSVLDAAVEPFEYRRKLLYDISQCNEFLIKLIPAFLAIPLKSVNFILIAFSLYNKSYGIGRTLRRMRCTRR